MHRLSSGPLNAGPTRESDTHRVGLGKPSRATMMMPRGWKAEGNDCDTDGRRVHLGASGTRKNTRDVHVRGGWEA